MLKIVNVYRIELCVSRGLEALSTSNSISRLSHLLRYLLYVLNLALHVLNIMYLALYVLSMYL